MTFLDFLSLGEEAQERDLERLLGQLRRFLLELGVGFAFVGSQHGLAEDSALQPESAGKMNFYLAAVDDQLRHRDDQLSIGLIICKTNNGLNKLI